MAKGQGFLTWMTFMWAVDRCCVVHYCGVECVFLRWPWAQWYRQPGVIIKSNQILTLWPEHLLENQCRAHVKQIKRSLCNLISSQVANHAGNRRGGKMATLHVILAISQELCTPNFHTEEISPFPLFSYFRIPFWCILSEQGCVVIFHFKVEVKCWI